MTSSKLFTESVFAKDLEAGVQGLSINEKKIGFLDLPGAKLSNTADLGTRLTSNDRAPEHHLRPHLRVRRRRKGKRGSPSTLL
jgi:hypothetical protein